MGAKRDRGSRDRRLRGCGWLYVGLIGIWFGLRWVFADRWWWLALLNTFAIYLFTPLLLLLPFAFIQRRYGLLAGLMLPGLVLVTLFGELFLPPFGQGRETAKVVNDSSIGLNFMSFNLRWDNPHHEKIADTIRSAQADVVGFQEVRPDHVVGFLQHLPEYPHRYFQLTKEFHNVGIISRFPIRSVTPINVEDSRIERGFQVELLVNDEPIRVIVTHLAPNNAPLLPLPEFAKITQGRQEQRLQQVGFLEKVLSQSRQPTIVLCDCNFTPISGTYRRLNQLMQDSFYEVGWGLGHTIKLDAFPMYLGRIDYVWHSREFRSISAIVGDSAGSDHRPMIARLELMRDLVARR